MRLPTGLRALQHRDFRLFWSAQIVSLVGRWMQSVGQSWLVLELTDSPLKLGIVNSLQFAPILVLSFPAGAVADRVPKRSLLTLTQIGLMVPALGVAALVWTGLVEFWHVAAMAAMMGVANAIDMPARQSMVVELVGKDDLVNAVSLNSAVFNAARIVGPAVGGLLIARYGVAVAFFVNGVTFLAPILALLAMRPPPARRRVPGRLTTEVAEGLRHALGSPLTTLILGLVLAVSVFVINHNVTIPLLARDFLHQDVRGFGFLMASLGAGALVASALLAQFGRGRPPLASVFVPATLLCLGVTALAAVRDVWLAATVLFVIGLAQILFLASCNTTLQVTSPDALRGRVMSLYTLVFAGVSPIGAFVVGSIAEAFDVVAACAAGGGLGLAAVLALTVHWRSRTERAE
jgi:MFS family permease